MKRVEMGPGKGPQARGILLFCSFLIHGQPCSVHCLHGTTATSRFLVWAGAWNQDNLLRLRGKEQEEGIFFGGWRRKWEELLLFLEHAEFEALLGHLDGGDQIAGEDMGLELMGAGGWA